MSNKEGEAKACFVEPPVEIFDNEPAQELPQSVNKGMDFYVYQKTVLPPSGGIFNFYEGQLYPQKGFPYPEATWRNDTVKRANMFVVRILANPMLLPAWFFFLISPWFLKKKLLSSILEHWNRLTYYLLSPCFLKENRYCESVRELRVLIHETMKNLGLDSYESSMAAQTIATIIQYDDAYRYRMEDLLTEVTAIDFYRKPFGTMHQIAELIKEREIDVKPKLLAITKVASLLFLVPRFRRAFRQSLKKVDWGKLQLDEIDRYHCLNRDGYNFFGQTFEERIEHYKKIHKGEFPATLKV